ncbi:MAG TPA: hypothetical protein VF399_04905 [bacterium]
MNVLLMAVSLWASLNYKPLSPQVYAGPDYGFYKLYQDSLETGSRWQFGGEIGVENIIPNIGIRVHGTYLRYEVPMAGMGTYVYDYIPISFCTEFNMLPFIRTRRAAIYLVTGLGWYLWKASFDGETITLPSGGKMEEKDLGFIGGISLRIKLLKNVGVEAVSRYHYMASADLDKYGYFDKDDKLWENGFSLKFLFP